MLSGWALQPGAKYRYRVDAMIPFSDHADHPGLMECIQRVRPRGILTVHGFARNSPQNSAAAASTHGPPQVVTNWSCPSNDPPRNDSPAIRGPGTNALSASLRTSPISAGSSRKPAAALRRPVSSTYLTGLEKDNDLRTAVSGSTTIRPAPMANPSPYSTPPPCAMPSPSSPVHGRNATAKSTTPTRTSSAAPRLFLQDLQFQPDMIDLPGTTEFVMEFRESPAHWTASNALPHRLATLHPAEGETFVKLLTNDLRLGIELP